MYYCCIIVAAIPSVLHLGDRVAFFHPRAHRWMEGEITRFWATGAGVYSAQYDRRAIIPYDELRFISTKAESTAKRKELVCA